MKGPATAMSGDADDKLAACFNWPCTSKDRATQEYFDACARWFAMLSPDDRDAVRTIIDVVASAHEHAAIGLAAIREEEVLVVIEQVGEESGLHWSCR